MMDEPLVLALDQGTQSVRAMLFNRDGELIARYQQHIEPYFSHEPGQAEQHASYFWEQLGLACQGLWEQHGALKHQVKAVALTTQRASVAVSYTHLTLPTTPYV